MLLPIETFGLNALVDTLKAVAEPSRLRIVSLLSRGDLTVTDITEILNQSQPRVSRHLKLLLEAGLIDRYQEGSWAFFTLSDADGDREFAKALVAAIDSNDTTIARDIERLEAVRLRRKERAADYFSANAESWDEIRSLHAPDQAVEQALLEVIGDRPFQSMLDVGTGTGRMLELFAPLCIRSVGIDLSRDMLAIARTNLESAGIADAQVRQGDIYAPPVDRDSFDLVVMHQVLHFLEDPAAAVREAARLLRPSGRFLVVDFAPHELEFLRDEHAHYRLGISDDQIADWFAQSDLELETTREIAPAEEASQQLTVKIWLGRDPRMLIADENTQANTRTTA